MLPAATKEVSFFNSYRFHKRGLLWYRSRFPTVFQKHLDESIMKGRCLAGEATPDYIIDPRAPERIAKYIPGAKLIAILRDPVARAYSQYQMNVRNQTEVLPLEEALEKEKERLGDERERMVREPDYYSQKYNRYSYLLRGVYVNQLVDWFSHFPKERILVTRAEDLFSDPRDFMKKISQFLGIPFCELDEYKRYNFHEYLPIKPGTIEKLREYFRPHNRSLYKLLGRDFGWGY